MGLWGLAAGCGGCCQAVVPGLLLWLGCYFNKVDTSLKLFTASWNLWDYGSWLQVVGDAAKLAGRIGVKLPRWLWLGAGSNLLYCYSVGEE